jgi:hypothetical protein
MALRVPPLRVSPSIARVIAGVWGVLIAATTSAPFPSWGHWLVVCFGIVLAGVKLIPTSPMIEESDW